MKKEGSLPSFLISAGARFITTRPLGNVNPEFFTAERIRSFASETALSGRPTILMFGSELITSISASTMRASIPTVVAVIHLQTIILIILITRRLRQILFLLDLGCFQTNLLYKN